MAPGAERIEAIARETIAKLPPEFVRHLANVVLHIEELADDKTLDEMVFRSMVRDGTPFYDPLGLVSEGTRIDFQVEVNSYLVHAVTSAGLDVLRLPIAEEPRQIEDHKDG